MEEKIVRSKLVTVIIIITVTSLLLTITYELKSYNQRDVWSDQVAEKSVYAV